MNNWMKFKVRDKNFFGFYSHLTKKTAGNYNIGNN